MHAIYSHTQYKNESTHSEMGPVRQNPIHGTVSLFICVRNALCTIVAHNIAQNRHDNFPSYPLDNHHCSDDVYLREGGGAVPDGLSSTGLLTWHRGSVCVSSTDIFSTYHHTIGSPLSADKRLLWLVRQSGCLFRTTSDRLIPFRVRGSRGEMYISHGPSPHSHATPRTRM